MCCVFIATPTPRLFSTYACTTAYLDAVCMYVYVNAYHVCYIYMGTTYVYIYIRTLNVHESTKSIPNGSACHKHTYTI